MSHNLHRYGTIDSLKDDYPVLSRPANGFNDQGAKAKLQFFAQAASRHNLVNIGVSRCGNIFTAGVDTIISELQDRRTVNVVFDNKNNLREFLRELIDNGYDLSVTTAGLMEDVLEICRELGIKPHSVNLSLGIFGRKDKLPSDEVLQFTTMCGHHQIAPQLVEMQMELLKKGKTTPEQAAATIGRHCPCGIFNTVRAARLFDEFLHRQER